VRVQYVRDVATAHLLAMTAPEAVGKRFICNAECYWCQEIAFILEKHFGDRGSGFLLAPICPV
jgi:dihydroflavonol-4-reductase